MMKKIWSLCLVCFALMLGFMMPAAVKAAKKTPVNMPKKIVSYDGDMKLSQYKLSYDRFGRLKSVKIHSYMTDKDWSYSIAYKKADGKITATLTYDGGDAPEQDTYIFSTKGLLQASKVDNEVVWDYYPDGKTPATMTEDVTEVNSRRYTFTSKGRFDYVFFMNDGKYSARNAYFYDEETGLVESKKSDSFQEEGEEITDEMEANMDSKVFDYKTTKSKEIGQTAAAKWIDNFFLLHIVYAD